MVEKRESFTKTLLGDRDRFTDAIRPSNGKLVLFPSYFWHGTIPFASSEARLTVAFDVVPRVEGGAGSLSAFARQH